MKVVLHLLRKNSQLKASFIFNQIKNHIEYRPLVVFYEDRQVNNDGGFVDESLGSIEILNIGAESDFVNKVKFKLFRRIPESATDQLKKIIEDNNVELLHFHYGSDCGIYESLLKSVAIPSVVSFYGYDCSSFPKLFFGYGKKYLQERVFKKVSRVLAMSPDMKKDLMNLECPEEKITVHYYGTNTQLFKTDKEYPGKKEVVLLILASLTPKKGHIILLEALVKLIHKGINNFHLRIVGTGECESELKKFVDTNDLNKKVSFVGAIKYASAQMFSEYKNADVFIHPSVTAKSGDKEGIPGTIIEAMATGLPVISTYHSGIPFIIKHNMTGSLVAENDSEALAVEIEKMINDENLRKAIGKKGQEYALNELDLRNKEKELEAIYTKELELVGK